MSDYPGGWTHDAREQLQRALHIEREQILANPGNSWRRFNVAVYLMALGMPAETGEQVRESLELGASAKDILVAIRDFEDFQIATGFDVLEIICVLRADLR